jgi:hypothetical protein
MRVLMAFQCRARVPGRTGHGTLPCWRRFPCRTSRGGDFSFIGLLNGAPDLAKRSEEILREEFAKCRY